MTKYLGWESHCVFNRKKGNWPIRVMLGKGDIQRSLCYIRGDSTQPGKNWWWPTTQDSVVKERSGAGGLRATLTEV